ncbi:MULTISPECIES: spondin domain-containing protein [unclassified Pseudoalteromonas]|uniref:spondin domain-containing protein n=1 Tax=unclassified Pseudoalteromonas TaxID=194690 RepID=UPI0005A8D5BD|nr:MULTISPECIES: spondin domain-containing protein [unclassified Pseudoalteromonas]
MFNKKSLLLPLLGVTLLGCSGGDNNNEVVEPITPPAPTPMYSFEVTVKNLTYAQPLSPIGIALHTEGNFWQLGQTASVELETLAESGDNSGLLGLSIVNTSISDAAPLGPGSSITLTLTTEDIMDAKLSLVSMMVNTNDGFSGLNAIDVSALEVGSQLNFKTGAYDSGTEVNNEASGTIPGPADMGEGFNAARDDVDFVAVHPGVVSSDDGLTQSVLNYTHKFDNPLMGVSITRIQ